MWDSPHGGRVVEGLTVLLQCEEDMDDTVTITLVPGWNLISLPFQPPNPAINAILPIVHPADIVMTWDAETETWLVSRRDAETSLFMGDVTVLTATTAYFVRTQSDAGIALVRPPQSTLAAPPAVSIIHVAEGWNLVPILCTSRPMPEAIDANFYFATLGESWLKAVAYDTATDSWDSLVPHYKGYVTVGKGYWLYAAKPGVIVP